MIRILRVRNFLRKLSLRQYRNLFRRNLILNYFFYNNFLKDFSFKKNSHFYYLFFNKNNYYGYYFPAFFLKKNVFNTFNKFKKMKKNFNFDYFFYNSLINNSFKKDELFFKKKSENKKGIKVSILNYNEESFINFINDEENENKNVIFNKFLNNKTQKNQELKELNYFFNFNLYQNNILEIYKIIIILYISNLYK